MIIWAKHHLIPHKGNNHRPKLLRKEAARGILGLLVMIELLFILQAFVFLPNFRYFAAVISSSVVTETNRHRTDDALLTLAVDPLLELAAERKAKDMAEKGYFSHVGPSGEQPWKWIRESGYYYLSAGENLAINFIDSKDVTDAWMNSPTHKANILNGKFTEIGIGVAEGMYQGQKTTFVVQFFATPYEKPPVLLADTSGPLPVSGKAVESQPKTKPNPGSPTEERTSIPPPPPPLEEVVQNISVESSMHTEKPEEPETTTILGTQTEIRGGQITPPPKMISLFLSNPEKTTKTALLSITFFLALATLLTMVIKKERTHYDLITNGLTLLAIILFVVLLNDFISTKDFLVL